MAQVFYECGLGIVKANNSRVQGWMSVKEMLKPMDDGRPGLLVFDCCKGLIDDLQAIQHDEKNVSDCAKQPHELTHRPDALRYFCQMRTLKPEIEEIQEEPEEQLEDYESFMTGGSPDASYIAYA